MTDMRRITIALPVELDEQILKLRKQDEFIRCSYAEIVRRLMDLGLQAQNQQSSQAG